MNRRKWRGKCSGMNHIRRRGKCSDMNHTTKMAKHEAEVIEVVNGSGRSRGREDRDVGGRERDGGRRGTIRAS